MSPAAEEQLGLAKAGPKEEVSPLDSASAEQLDPANAGPLGPVGAGRWALQTRIAGLGRRWAAEPGRRRAAGLCRCGAAEPGRHRAGGLGRRGAVGPGRRGTLGPAGEGPLGRWRCEAAERKNIRQSVYI